MSAEVTQNPPTATTESKSARKKREKAAAAGTGNGQSLTATPAEPTRAESSADGKVDGDSSYESPYIKELHKNIRNVSKKLTALQKTDAIVAENPGVSLDELVAKRKINADQKASQEKKPGLQASLQQFQEQIAQYQKFDSEYQSRMVKEREELVASHKAEIERLKEELAAEQQTSSQADVREKILVFSQFLRAAAAKRVIEEEADTEESRAFEGALLLVYGGDQKAVDAAVNLIEGTDETVLSIDGTPLSVKYSQIKQASVEHAPFSAEETWVDSVAEANAAVGDEQQAAETNGQSSFPIGTDPTLVNAGMTELDTSAETNGASGEPLEKVTSPVQASTGDDAGNKAGDSWDTNMAGATAGAESAMEESFEMVPRDQHEVDTPVDVAANTAAHGSSWADEPATEPPAGNKAAEGWDFTAKQTDDGWNKPAETNGAAAGTSWADGATDAAAGAQDDGFHEVSGRRGRGGGNRGRGDGEYRGRGRGRGGSRGDGDYRGRGRGGFRGGRGDGEFRGRGRGRGNRGDGAPAPVRT